MYINTKALILRETRYQESSKILTVLTEHEGRLTISAKGALRKNSKFLAVTQLLAYSEMVLFCSKGRYTLTEAREIELFGGLRRDIIPLALGAYIAELAEAVSDEDAPGGELLSLCLNTLYALGNELRSPVFIKPVFETRLAAVSGFSPLLTHCAACGGTTPREPTLDIEGGVLYCSRCIPSEIANAKRLNPGTLAAIKHITSCNIKKIFAFELSENSRANFTKVAEIYLLTHLDRRFRTLEYFKKL